MKLNKFEEAYLKIINECNNKHIIKENSSDGDFEAGKYYKLEVELNYPECDEELEFYQSIYANLSEINNNGVQINFGDYESSPFGGQLEITLFWKGDNFINSTYDDILDASLELGETISTGDFEHEEISKEEYNTLFKNRLTSTKFKKWLKDVEKEINEDDEDDEDDEEFSKTSKNKLAIASNPNTPKEVLIKLANDGSFNVCLGVTENPNIPLELLFNMSKGNEDQRRCVARCLRTPQEVLIKLANDGNEWVREDVGLNPNTPKEVLRKFADDASWLIRNNVAKNPNTPKEVLIKLANDENSNIRENVARNQNTPKEILTKLADDEDCFVREDVAGNSNTPKEVLIKLTNDEKEWVREKAQMALNKNK